MHIVTTHKGTDFDALASVAAANLLYPDSVTVLPTNLNPNVRAFLSLHRDLFDFCGSAAIDLNAVDKLTVVDTNRWDRLDRLDTLEHKQSLDIHLYDHHGDHGDIRPAWQCQEQMGANITLMLRYLKEGRRLITPIQAGLFLLGLYEDTGNLTFPSTKAEDARAAAYLLENGADLHVIGSFLSPTYSRKQKDVLFRMLRRSERILIDGYSVSINRLKVRGYTSNLALVVQMYRQILNVDAAFGVFSMEKNRCLVIGRSRTEAIDIAAIMRNMGGGGHPAAGSAMLKSIDPAAVETWIREMIGDHHGNSVQIRDLMSFPVWTLSPDMAMGKAGQLRREKGYKGAPVVDGQKLVGILSKRDFRKIKKKSHLKGPVKAFMTQTVVTIAPDKSPGHGARLMVRYDIGRLPVVKNGKVIGIFSRSDAIADFYGLCPLGTPFSKGCKKKQHASTDPEP